MSLETRIVAGVLLAVAGIAVFVLWLQSAELFDEAVVEGLAGPQPMHAPPADARRGRSRDALLRAARETGFKRFDAVGHADRLGPAAYNMALSERRAASVRDYLVQNEVDATLVRADAKGELEPVSGDACASACRPTAGSR